MDRHPTTLMPLQTERVIFAATNTGKSLLCACTDNRAPKGSSVDVRFAPIAADVMSCRELTPNGRRPRPPSAQIVNGGVVSFESRRVGMC